MNRRKDREERKKDRWVDPRAGKGLSGVGWMEGWVERYSWGWVGKFIRE